MRGRRPRLRSVWVFHVDAGACNGCDIEVLDVLTPFYDVERFGVKLVPTPRQADALLVTGSVNRQVVIGLKRAYEAMPPKPRIVVAIGACAISGGIFYDSLSVYGGVDKVIPVHLYIPGCPPRPEAILFGLGQLLGLVNKKVSLTLKRAEGPPETVVRKGLVSERLVKDLRYFVTRYVGYYDRDTVMGEVLAAAAESPNVEVFKRLLAERASRIRDGRVREAVLVAGGFVAERVAGRREVQGSG